jgi:hypothetical protein
MFFVIKKMLTTQVKLTMETFITLEVQHSLDHFKEILMAKKTTKLDQLASSQLATA